MTHRLGEVWRERGVWKVQLPHGIETTNTKKRAQAFAQAISVVDVNEDFHAWIVKREKGTG